MVGGQFNFLLDLVLNKKPITCSPHTDYTISIFYEKPCKVNFVQSEK